MLRGPDGAGMCPATGRLCAAIGAKKRRAGKPKVPSWTRPFDELREESRTGMPVWERPSRRKQRHPTFGEVSAWMSEHPEWIAGRLVSPERVEVWYFSHLNAKGEREFGWRLTAELYQAMKTILGDFGFEEYSDFESWDAARRLEEYPEFRVNPP